MPREPTPDELMTKQGDARVGPKPPGPGFDLGVFGCLMNGRAEIVADTILGHGLGARADEQEALERFRWIGGISALDRPALSAAALDFLNTGLVRVRQLDGRRVWERAALTARPARDPNLPPPPVGRAGRAGRDPRSLD